MKLFVLTFLNGLTLAGLYFLVASGFTLVFGLMRNVNLAHGSLYLLGAYIGFEVGDGTGSWFLAVVAGFLSAAVFGILLQILVFRRMEGQELRQTMVTIGISIVAADLMLAIWTGETYQFEPPDWLYGGTPLPFVKIYPTIRIMVLVVSVVVGVALWLFLTRTRIGMMIRAGVDDRGMLSASGVNVQRVFATTFAVGAGLAGFAGVVGGSALSISPGEDTRYLLASLIVVIVGGMGSVPGAAIGALMIGLAEQFGLAYFAHLQCRLHLLDHGRRPRHPPAGHHGAGMSAVAEVLPGAAPRWLRPLLTYAIAAVALVIYPLIVPDFWAFQIGAQSLFLGVISLSLMFLGGYGGMVSLAQMTIAGVAGYVIAIIGGNSLNFGLDVAVVGGSPHRHCRRHARGDADRRDLGPHGRHLHHHDHDRHRHGVLLSGPAELHALQRAFGIRQHPAAAGLRSSIGARRYPSTSCRSWPPC